MFGALAGESFVSVTTYRRSGKPVPTPVWIAADRGTLLVWTGAESGKVKRLRHTARITIAPCDRQGRLLGDPVPAHARIMARNEMRRVNAAMIAKYGIQFRLSRFGARIGRLVGIKRRGQIGLEITLD